MPTYADLEISLHRRDADSYAVELRFTPPDSDADVRLLEESPVVTFEVKTLRQHHLNDEDYGQTLTQILFGQKNGPMIVAFDKARLSAQQAEATLRVRLFIDPSASELHSLRWETLRDPQFDSHLLTSEQIIFSRYLSSLDWRPVRLRAQSKLKALVVIANPTDLDPEQLAPLDVATEQARAEAGLGKIEITTLASGGQATLSNIARHLRDGYDILYLVCHGALEQGNALLWLEDDDGNADVISGETLVMRLHDLRQRPRLIVLASCQSAGQGDKARTDDHGALSALGPLLARVGIPAVLAMQGNITMQTVKQFMPEFFRELQRDGQIDRAMAAARSVVQERSDWWMPVLFMRLKSGQLWYIPHFADDREGLKKWPALLDSIFQEECTPILGPGLAEPLFGARLELAQQLANEYRFPMAPHARDDLPQVGQYVVVTQTSRLLPRQFMQYLFHTIATRYRDHLPDKFQSLAAKQKLPDKTLIPTLHQLTQAVGQYRRTQNPAESFHVLARLPFPIYITTDPTNALFDALGAAGKSPHLELCRWNRERFKGIPARDLDFEPDPDNPLVYHLFGHIDWPESLVLTEDDYFDYLIGFTRDKELVPDVVRAALANSALLFLGFQMDDWNFRVLFRSILAQEGSESLKYYAHIAAQITPEEGRILEPARARQYLETYFLQNEPAAISIYWGSPEDFLTQLHDKWDWEEGQPK